MLAKLHSSEPFAAPELELACGFPVRSLQFLGRAGHLPEPIEKGSRGRATLFDFHGFQVLAMMGALHSTAMPLVLASRIARPIAKTYRSIYGAVPWGEAELSRLVLEAGASAKLEWESPSGRIEPLSLHSVVSTLPGYTPGAPLKSDMVLGLVQASAGRMFVYTVAPIQVFPNDINAQPELVISGVARGSDGGEIETFENIFAFAPETYQAREVEAVLAYKRAVAVLTVNVSLAIRNALDAVAAGRAK